MVDGSLVLFGGQNSQMLNDVNIFDLRTWKWTKVQTQSGVYAPEPRYGHSAVQYGANVIVYGGYRHFVKSFKVRDTYGDVAVFSTDTLSWDKPVTGGLFTFRRHH